MSPAASPSSSSSSAPPPTPLSTLLIGLGTPVWLLIYNLSFLPFTLLLSLLSLDTSATSIRHRWFARFWHVFGPGSAERLTPHMGGVLRRQVRGVVVDVGPGAGHSLWHYDAERIERLVCVEPNREHHRALRRRANDAGLGAVTDIVVAGIHELTATDRLRADGKDGTGTAPALRPGEVDTVVTLQVLCSVQDPHGVAADLYALLKPDGGTWIAWEHVRANSSIGVVNVWQRMVNVVWPAFFGGCELCRDTGALLKGAGKWKTAEVDHIAEDWECIPHIRGVLVKA